jgi:integrase
MPTAQTPWIIGKRATAPALAARGRGGEDAGNDQGRPLTVDRALDAYALDLQARRGGPVNVSRVRKHLPASLAEKAVALLGARELRRWRDNLIAKKLKPAAVTRTAAAFRAALNLAAASDPRITNTNAWKIGLASIPGAQESRNVILTNAQTRAIVSAAYEKSDAWGLFVEVHAVTGARSSQIRELAVRDLQGDRNAPRVMMPSSHKGRGHHKVALKPVPIPAALFERLRRAAAGRAEEAPLLIKHTGQPWARSDHTHPFRQTATRVGLDPGAVTIYALRHSSIVRQLLASVPVRIVASGHDTSVAMIERTYSRYISDHSDVLVRRALIDLDTPAADNVVALRDR